MTDVYSLSLCRRRWSRMSLVFSTTNMKVFSTKYEYEVVSTKFQCSPHTTYKYHGPNIQQIYIMFSTSVLQNAHSKFVR